MMVNLQETLKAFNFLCLRIGIRVSSTGGCGGEYSPIFPPKTFIVKLNNNCIKYVVYAFFALSSAVLYCISKV